MLSNFGTWSILGSCMVFRYTFGSKQRFSSWAWCYWGDLESRDNGSLPPLFMVLVRIENSDRDFSLEVCLDRLSVQSPKGVVNHNLSYPDTWPWRRAGLVDFRLTGWRVDGNFFRGLRPRFLPLKRANCTVNFARVGQWGFITHHVQWHVIFGSEGDRYYTTLWFL